MNLQKISIRWYALVIMIGLCSVQISVHAMEVLEEAFIEGAGKDLFLMSEEGALEVAEGAAQKAAQESLGMTQEAFEALSENVKVELTKSFEAELGNFAEKFNAYQGNIDAAGWLDNSLSKANSASFESIKNFEFPEGDWNTLSEAKFEGLPEGKTPAELLTKVEYVDPAWAGVNEARGQMTQALNDYEEAYKAFENSSPADPEYEVKKTAAGNATLEVEKAIDAFETELDKVTDLANSDLTSKTQAADAAAKNTEVAKQSGSKETLKTAETEQTAAEGAKKDAAKGKDEASTKSYREKRDAAKTNYKTTEATYNSEVKLNDEIGKMQKAEAGGTLDTYISDLDEKITSLQSEIDGLNEKLEDPNIAKGDKSSAEKSVKSKQAQLDEATKYKTVAEEAKVAEDPAQSLKDAKTASDTRKTDAAKAKKTAYDKYKDAYTQSVEKTTVWGSLKNGDFKTVGYKGVEWVKKVGLSSLEQAVGGAFFAIGTAAISAFEAAQANSALLDSFASVQTFGNVNMRIPDSLINSDNPASSVFVYVGIPVPGDATNTDSYGDNANQVWFITGKTDFDSSTCNPVNVKPANFYASYDSSGNWGSSYIGGTTFPDAMVHLNTGFKFAGNGDPVDLEDLLVSYFPETGDTQSLVSQSTNLSGAAAGGVTTDTTKLIFFTQETTFEGDKVVSCMLNAIDPKSNPGLLAYEGSQYSYPPTLQASIDTIRQGVYFNTIKLAEVVPLTEIQVAELSKAGALDASTYSKISVLPYVSLGIYAYQTYDTPLVKTGVLKGKGLPDIVVALNNLDEVLPAHSVDASGTYGFAQLGSNPNVTKICSLVDGTVYNSDGSTGGILAPTLPNSFASFNDQILALKTYVEEKMKYGPFSYGTKQLSIDKTWADAGVPVYKIAGGLNVVDANGVALDDYVVPVSMVSGPHTVMLPEAFNYLLSVITSRFYILNKLGNNQIIPATNTAPCYICQSVDSDNKVINRVSTSSCLSTEEQVYYDPAVPFSNMFMDSDINPIAINSANYTKTDVSVGDWLPVPAQWAFNAPLVLLGSDTTKISLASALQSTGQIDLLNTINSVYKSWKGLYISTMDSARAIKNEVGPFKWSMVATVPVTIEATSLADIIQGIYVYQLEQYPDEYVIISDSATAAPTNLLQFNAVTPQRYAISLSSGMVYDSTNSGAVVVDANGLPKKIDPTSALQNLTVIAQNADLYQKIVQSQGLYKQTLDDNKKYYGGSVIFLFPEDQVNGQYIYADITGISDYADQYVKGTLLSNVKDFFVLSDGKTYGVPYSNNVKEGASVVSGQVYNWNQYVGRYTSEEVKNIDINGLPTYFQGAAGTNLLQYQDDLLKMVTTQALITHPGNPLSAKVRDVVTARIGQLTQPLYNIVLTQQQEYQDLVAQRAAKNPPLDVGSVNNLDGLAYEADTIFGPRYLKYFGSTGKYYFVSPSVPEGGVKYIDFSAGTAGIVMTYNSEGEPLGPISNPYLAATTRINNGIYISGGKQTLGMPINNPGIPVSSMVKLDATVLQSNLDSAQSAFTSAFSTFVKGGSSAALQQAAATLGLAKVAYQSALVVQAQAAQINAAASSGATFEFYMNQDINYYYVLATTATDKYYIDLLSGFEYNIDGTPRFTRNSVFKNLYGTQDELFYHFSTVDTSPSSVGTEGQDPLNPNNSLLGLVYTGTEGVFKTYSQDGPAVKVRNSALITDFYGIPFTVSGSEQVLSYDMSSIMPLYTVDDQGNQIPAPYPDLKVYQNDPTYSVSENQIKKFAINEIVTDETGAIVEMVFTGSYTPEAGVYSMMPLYYQTRTGSDVIMTDSTLFAQQPLILVWDGGSDLKYQRVLYKGQMLPVTGSAPTYSAGSVQIMLQKDDASLAQWLTVIDGATQYDFLLDSEIFSIAESKQSWGLNIVTNAQGQSQLVNSLPTLQSVTIANNFIDAVQFTKTGSLQSSRVNIITATLGRVKYDPINQRYLYNLTTANDSGKSYFTAEWNGWYVDLLTGVLYDLNGYPQISMSTLQLWDLLAALEMNVVYADQNTMKLAYRSGCNIVMQDIAQGLTVEQSDKDRCKLISK